MCFSNLFRKKQPDKKESNEDKVKRAIQSDEIDQLFLGASDYVIPWGKNDLFDDGIKNNLGAIYSYLLDYKKKYKDHNMLSKLAQAMYKLCHHGSSETLYIVAYFIRSEAGYRNYYSNPPLQDLDLDTLAGSLKRKIWFKKSELTQEKKYFGGNYFEDGVYGQLKAFSKRSKEAGGPTFI